MSAVALTAEQRDLVTQFRGLALGIARRMWCTRRHPPFEDYVSSADLGLVQAAQGYVPGPERPFPPYAACRIVGSVRDWLGNESKATTIRHAARECSLRLASEVCDDDESFEAHDPVETRRQLSDKAAAIRGAFLAGLAAAAERPHGEDAIIERGQRRLAIEAVNAAIANMPERDQTILRGHYFRSEPLSAIAEAMGASYRSVRRWHEDALVRLANRVTARGAERGAV